MLVKKHQYQDLNLITLGYRQDYPDCIYPVVDFTTGIVCQCSNEGVNQLKNPTWTRLHQIIGDDLMMHLLLNFRIFVKLPQPTAAYVQLVGSHIKQATAKRKQPDKPFQFMRSEIFYAKQITRSKKPISIAGVRRLIGKIFPDQVKGTRLSRFMLNLVPILHKCLAKVQICDPQQILKQVCPLSSAAKTALDSTETYTGYYKPEHLEQGYLTQEEDEGRKRRKTNSRSSGNRDLYKQDLIQLLTQDTPPHLVYSFLLKYLKHVLPGEMFGSKNNRAKLKQSLSQLISLEKDESFDLGKIALSMKITQIEWLSTTSIQHPSDLKKRQRLVETLLHWVYSHLVAPVLQNSFYVTEAEGDSKNAIKFYRQAVWKRIE